MKIRVIDNGPMPRKFEHMRFTAIDDETYDGPNSLHGFGDTEENAVQDLMNLMAEVDEIWSWSTLEDET